MKGNETTTDRIRTYLELYGLESEKVVPAYLVIILAAAGLLWAASQQQVPSKDRWGTWNWVYVAGDGVREGFYRVGHGASYGDVLRSAAEHSEPHEERLRCWDQIPLQGPVGIACHMNSSREPNRLDIVRLPEQYCYLFGMPIEINRASVKELMLLPGIGPTMAKRIDAYRRDYGPFREVDDLEAVQGIGKKTLARLADRIVVEPPEVWQRSIWCP